VPCIVNSWSYSSGLISRLSGTASWARMMSAWMPARAKKNAPVTM
jgi:hypothetical protein